MYTQQFHSVIGFYQWGTPQGGIVALPRVLPTVRVIDANEAYGFVETGLLRTPWGSEPKFVDCSRRWIAWEPDQFQEVMAAGTITEPIRVIDHLAYRRMVPSRRQVAETIRPDQRATIVPGSRIPTKKAYVLVVNDEDTAKKYGLLPDNKLAVTADAVAAMTLGFPGRRPGEEVEENPNILHFLAALKRGELIAREAPVSRGSRTTEVDAELAAELGVPF